MDRRMCTSDLFFHRPSAPAPLTSGALDRLSIGSVLMLLAMCGIAGCGSKPPVTGGQPRVAATPSTGALIDLTGQTDVDAKLAKMQESLKEAHSLVLHRTDVSGAGLRSLKVATRLRTLDLRETSI